MITEATTHDELEGVANFATKWGERGEEWSLPFSRIWFRDLWGRLLASGQGAVFYQPEGAIGVSVVNGFDGELEAREEFWIGGDRGLLRAAEEWAVNHGALRIMIGRPEGPHSSGLDRLHGRDGYRAIEQIFCKELV